MKDVKSYKNMETQKSRLKAVNLFLDSEVYDSFRAYAKRRDLSVSQLLRQAMRELLDKGTISHETQQHNR